MTALTSLARGIIIPGTRITSFGNRVHDCCLFDAPNGTPACSFLAAGGSDVISVATVPTANPSLYYVIKEGADYKVLFPTNIACTAIGYITPAYVGAVSSLGSILHKVPCNFTRPTGTVQQFSHVYCCRGKLPAQTHTTIFDIWPVGMRPNFWSPLPGAVLDAYVDTFAFDVKFLNDVSAYTPAFSNGIKAALASSSPATAPPLPPGSVAQGGTTAGSSPTAGSQNPAGTMSMWTIFLYFIVLVLAVALGYYFIVKPPVPSRV